MSYKPSDPVFSSPCTALLCSMSTSAHDLPHCKMIQNVRGPTHVPIKNLNLILLTFTPWNILSLYVTIDPITLIHYVGDAHQ